MKPQLPLHWHRRNVHVFIACLLSFSLIIVPFIPITAAMSGGDNSGSVKEAQHYTINANPPIPAPAPAPVAAVITATKTDAIINDDGDSKADPGGAEKIEYTVTVSNTGTTDATNVTFSDTIDAHTTLVGGSVNTQPVADPDTYSASGNIQISLAAPGVLTNDRDPDTGNNTGLTVTEVQGAGANVGVATDTTATGRGGVKGSVTLNANGSFTYEPPPGFEGADTFTYKISDGTTTDTATVTINISGMVWFISNNAGGLNRGTFSNPFTTIASFNTANAGTGAIPDPKNGDFISLRTGTGTYSETDGVNLRSTQKLIGNAVQFNTVFTAAANSSAAYTAFAGAPGAAPTVTTSNGNGVDLAVSNTVRGFNVNNTPNFFKISGGAVGSPVINTMNLTGTGGALKVTVSGDFGANVSFGTLESTSSAETNLNLVGVTGTLGITSGGVGFSGSPITFVAVNVIGGTVAFTYPGNVTKNTDGSLVSISGGHSTGTITFSGGLSATLGDGLQFNNADGIYNFTGTTTLNGGNAGIDILNGSAGTFNFSANTTITNPTGTAFNVASSPGNPNVTYSGFITHNTAGQRAVNIDGTTGGAISINSVTAGSTAGGVGNTGVNINNAGGSVTFTTLNLGTSGTRMTAQAVTIAGGSGAKNLGTVSIFTTATAQGIVSTTSSGAITIGAGTVDTAGAAALNLTGTSNASRTPLNVQLQTVNTSGGASGIVLANTSATGSPGGFRVLGTGGTCTNLSTAGCSGGQIQNTTGADSTTASAGSGIHMTNVDTVVLTRMHIHDHQNYGIRGVNVNGFTLNTSVIKGVNGTNPGSPFVDGALVFDGTGAAVAQGLVGSCSITNSDIRGGRSDNLRIDNDGGTLNLTITGTTFRDTFDQSDANDNVFIELGNTAQGFVSITGSTFGETSGDHIQANMINTAVGHFTITGNTFTGTGSTKPSRLGMGILIAGGTWTGTCRYNISNNTMSGTRQGGAIHANKGGPTGGTMEGIIMGNTIGVAGSPESGASESSGIIVASRGNGGVHRTVVSNNTIHQTDEFGINIEVGEDGGATDNTSAAATTGPAAGMQATVTGNTIDTPGPNALHGIQINSGVQIGDNNTTCADIGGAGGLSNNVSTAANEAAGGADIRPRQRNATRIEMPGYGSTAFNNAQVQSYLAGRNSTTTVTATNNNATGTANDGFFNTASGAPCAQPTAPTLPSGPVTSDESATVNSSQSNQAVPYAPTAITTNVAYGSPNSTQPSLIARAVNALAQFAGKVESLVVPTAHASEEAVRKASIVENKPAQVAAQANREDTNQKYNSKTTNGRSRHVASHHATVRSGALAAPFSGENVSVNIGTLRPGDSVTITFQVTVDSPPNLNLLNPARVSNQGSVSFAEGASVPTDDPAVGGATDSTDTEVDLFNTSTTLASDLNPANFGEQVTLTATVAETPTQASADPSGTVDFIDTSNGDAVICNDVPLSGGSAQCQTSSLTASTHNIRADYSGDGNFDPSQSNIVAQVINACSANPIVTSTADAGAGTLREALTNQCNGTTITFDIAGPGPHTITLTTGALEVAKDVTINNNSGESITISGNNASRVFNIDSGKTASIIGLTMTGGASANDAGAILNDGALTIVNSTLSGNAAVNDGGAINSSATATSLTLINTTISGNTAALNGGGVFVGGGTVSSINSTITNNVADSDNNNSGSGGGISAAAGTTTLKNTIVAGNFNEDGASDAADDINGTVDAASSFNLIGGGGAGGLTNGVNNNQVGVASPGLAALANNGGTTQTHALLPTSPAVEMGSNANLPVDTFDLDGDADAAETLPVDQRGNGFPRAADSADANTTQTVDIGAFELHPSIEDIGDQTTNEDTVKNVTFNIGDDTGSLISTVTATSSNTTLVPNANLSFSGSGGSRTLQITPATDLSGATTITVTVTATNGRTATDVFDLTVNAANDGPVVIATAGNLSYTENDPATAIDPGLTVTDPDSTDLTGATVEITAGFVSAQDTLAFTNQLGITGNYNSGTGVLTLTGTTTVANYQTALRAVTYQNSSDNPTSSRTVTFTVSDGTSPGSATRDITINAVNDPPVNTVPGAQSTSQNTALIFSSGNSNQISVNDADAGSNAIQVTLTATNGTLTLSGTSGLSFSVGDGTADATMTFSAPIADINTALNGMTFNPTGGFSGAATVTITSNDLSNTGSGGPLTDTDVVNIQVALNVSIQDAQITEPSSGSINMVFTVTLNAPAPAGGASVNFTTEEQPPALNHATAGADYTTSAGTLNFAAGEQIKTILVPVLADNANSEVDETFLVVLSSPVNVTITDGTATGTILSTGQPGTILISELRTSGPAGAGDDFVEIYNNSDSPHTVNDVSGGYGLFKMGADCNANPILIGVIPNGTVIPARGNYLFVGSAYSLSDYGGTGAANGDQVLTQDIESDRNVALFNTVSLVNLSSLTRLDAVGFGSNVGGVCDLLREGATLTPLSGSVLEYSYFRDECGKKGNPATFGPCPTSGFKADTNENDDDFVFVDTAGTVTPAGQHLGAPGPQNLGSAVQNSLIPAFLIDSTKGAPTAPNRVRDLTPVTNGANGTLSVRRRFVNTTGQSVTRLRFRIVDFSSLASSPIADLRALTSLDVIVNGILDPATCAATGTPATVPCSVTVFGTTIETPPAQALGGALNSSFSAGTITVPTPLAPGESINLQFLLGVQQPGSFKFFFNIEALPSDSGNSPFTANPVKPVKSSIQRKK